MVSFLASDLLLVILLWLVVWFMCMIFPIIVMEIFNEQ